MKERAGNWSVKKQSLSELLSTLPIDWQWATHPRLIVLRSQFKSELPPCHGGIKNNVFVVHFLIFLSLTLVDLDLFERMTLILVVLTLECRVLLFDL